MYFNIGYTRLFKDIMHYNIHYKLCIELNIKALSKFIKNINEAVYKLTGFIQV